MCAALAAATVHADSKSLVDNSNHWAKESIETAVSKGYVDGYEDHTFRPDLSVTRAEFVKMAVTALKLPVSGETTGGDWYLPYVNAAVSAGIHRWSDFSNGDWNTPITRQEMARMIVRATDKELQKADTSKSDSELMYLATKAGLIQGLSGGELGVAEATTRAQSVTVIERILTVNGGGKLDVDRTALSYAEVELRGSNAETMLGVKPKALPMNLELGGPVKVELDQMLVVDLDSQEGAFRSLFPAVRKTNGKPLESEYLIALHLSLTSQETSGGYWSVLQNVSAFPPFVRTIISPEVADQTTVKHFQTYVLSRPLQTEGWYLMTVPKSYVQERIEQKEFSVLVAISGGFTYFTERMQ